MLDPPPEPPPLLERLFEPVPYLAARWLFLRALGFVFASAFYSLYFQIHGLIGTRGVLPVNIYLKAARESLGWKAYWLIPSALWLAPNDAMLTAIVVAGMLASIALMLNLWPRLSIGVAIVAFLSFVAAAQDFASYQSDGMLLEAAFLSLFFAPRGLRPGFGAKTPPSRAAWFLLIYEWFRIYFESGVVKILSGEEQWRNLTAMDKYYENGPLPTWIGWYVAHWPHGFHAFTAAATLIVELFVVWLALLPSKRARRIAFFITTPLQLGIIATSNYAFLNYLVLFLGILLLDDDFLRRRVPSEVPLPRRAPVLVAVILTTHFLTTTLMFFFPQVPTAVALAPTRIANAFGLFAVMTRVRYEIEFQGTSDGRTWVAYPFRYKPQALDKAPGLFAPYQPRFEWNLWFASLDRWENDPWVLNAEVRLMENSPQVLRLFASNPFAKQPPMEVRAVLWQYWFTSREEKTATGRWWRRELKGLYAPPATRAADGTILISDGTENGGGP